MSRIGKNPVQVPSGVNVKIENSTIFVEGKNGKLSYTYPFGVNVSKSEDTIEVSIKSDEYKNYWGLVRTLIVNMIEGVTKGFKKELLIIGVGYNGKMQGNKLVLSLGFSHQVEYEAPEGITLSIDKGPKGATLIRIEGYDKQKVGEIAAKIRSFKKPEPYKGKGIRYIDEVIKLKEGKTATK